MNDEEMIWERYKFLLEAHRAVPTIYGERPLNLILNNLEKNLNNLKKIFDKIKESSFKENLSDNSYTHRSIYVYEDLVDYLRSISPERWYGDQNIIQDIRDHIKYSRRGIDITYFQNLFERILRWPEFKERINEQIEFIGNDELTGAEKYVLSLIPVIDNFYTLANRFMENAKEDARIKTDLSGTSSEYHLKDIEEVYHASINAKEIYEKGFQKEAKVKNLGLGTGNKEGQISFTIDLYVAKEIAKHFKVCWLIANNQYKWRDFLNLLENKRKDQYSVKEILHELYLNGYLTKEYKPENGLKFLIAYTKSLIFLKDYYPSFMGTDYNSLFETLKTIPYKNIGVIKCNIKTEGRQYKFSEMEIRAYPEDITEITGFIS